MYHLSGSSILFWRPLVQSRISILDNWHCGWKIFFFFLWGCCPVHPRIFSSILAFSLAMVALYCQDICLQILPSVSLRGKIASSWELVYIEDKIKTTQPNFLTHVWSHTTCPSLSHTTPSRYRPSTAHLTPFHLYSCYYFCAHAETPLPLFLWTRNKHHLSSVEDVTSITLGVVTLYHCLNVCLSAYLSLL